MDWMKDLKGFDARQRRKMDYNMRETEIYEVEKREKGPKCPVCGGPLSRSIGRCCTFCGTVIKEVTEHE